MLLRNFIIWTVILYSGGLIFMYLEADEAKHTLSPSSEMNSLKKAIQRKLNTTTDEINALFTKLEKAVHQNGVKEPYSWNYYESCFFVGSLITTIGYGHIVPKTQGGQVFTIIYSLISIPLTMLVLRNLSAKITNTVTKIVSFMFRLTENIGKKRGRKRRRLSIGISPRLRRKLQAMKVKVREMPRKDHVYKFSISDTKVKISCIVVLTLLVILFILLSALIRVVSEGWAFRESVYFWFITITTVGFGDYVPYEGRKPKTLLVTLIYYIGTFYLLIGLALIASLIQCISILLEGRIPTVSAFEETNKFHVTPAETPARKYSSQIATKTSVSSNTTSRFSGPVGETIAHAVVECQAPFVGLFMSSQRVINDKD